ncbi:Yip1 family protein [Sphingomonas canadensis]|uniref:Yip1 family protein n=1 Tax=Sphingomonas canadensis TaxID=1219257 RepID=A0ABW3H406_9SPHN|nr:Yip1 family protein [Sphingomonas canadensis]MCW3835895.1 YIP1 family protein [Sphingomonas canadensis]
MIERIRNLIANPREEWGRIDAEPMRVRGIVTGWVLPLAAIGPVASTIALIAFGLPSFGEVVRPSAVYLVAGAVLGYALAVAGIYLLSMVIDMLAPGFGGQREPVQAMKVAAYSATASWLSQIFLIVPLLNVLVVVGLYSIFLLWTGLPRLMRANREQAAAYTVVVLVAAVVIQILISTISNSVLDRIGPPAPPLLLPAR